MENSLTNKRKISIDYTLIGLFVVLIILVVIFSFTTKYFFTYNNLLTILISLSVLGIAAASQTIVIISGGIDLSQESVLAVPGVIAAVLLGKGLPFFIVLIISISIGPIVGLINGLIVTKVKINPIIVTLAMLGIVRGVLVLSVGPELIPIKDTRFTFLGTTPRFIWNIPFCIIIMIITFLFFHYLITYTLFGRRIYAVGGNPQAARFSGINVDRIQIITYVINGTVGAIAGIVFAANIGWAVPIGGQGMIFKIVSAVFLGGALLGGGKGKIIGTVLGVAIIGIIGNGFVMLGFRLALELILVGVILILAVALGKVRMNRENNII